MKVKKSIIILVLNILLCVVSVQKNVAARNDDVTHLKVDFQTNNYFTDEIPAVNEPNSALSLRHVLALTLMHNPELKVFSLEIRAAQARELQAGLWPNPELEVEVENVAGTGEYRGFDSAESTIQLSQLIELGNKAGKRRKVAAFGKELANLDYQNKKLDVFSQVAKAFILVLQAQEKIRLSNELLDISEKSFWAVSKRVEAGKNSPVEKTRASVALANRKIEHRESERALEFARKNLISFWGQEMPQFKEVTGDLYTIEQLPTFAELSSKLQFNIDIIRWDSEIKKSKAILDLEKSKAIGDIKIGAGYKKFNDTDDNAIVFGISIPLPISDRNQGAKQEAIYNLAKSREEQKTARLKLQNEFNQAYYEFLNSFNQAMSLKNEVLPAAIGMSNAAAKEYQEGKTDYLNLLDAQRTLFDVKSEYLESLAICHIAKMEIERLIGGNIQNANISESEK